MRISAVLSYILSALSLVGLTICIIYLPATYAEIDREPEDFYLCIFWAILALIVALPATLNGTILIRGQALVETKWQIAKIANFVALGMTGLLVAVAILTGGTFSLEFVLSIVPFGILALGYRDIKRMPEDE